jgi:hypothetical protein
MTPSRLLVSILLLLISSLLYGNAENVNELSREQKIEQEVKRYAVPSLVEVLKKADAEGRVIPLESFSLTEPHRLLEAETMSRQAGHVHPALLDERYYAVTEDRESQKDLSYMEELRDRLYYVILDAEFRRPEFAFTFYMWDFHLSLHFEYDDSGRLVGVNSYQMLWPEDRSAPKLLEKFLYELPLIDSYMYRRITFKRSAPFYETRYISTDGGTTVRSFVYPFGEDGRRAEAACFEFLESIEGRLFAKLSGASECRYFHNADFRTGVDYGVGYDLRMSLREIGMPVDGLVEFLNYRYPGLQIEDLSVEIDYQAERVQFFKNQFMVLKYSSKGKSWNIELPDAHLSWHAPDPTVLNGFSPVMISVVSKNRTVKRHLTEEELFDIEREARLRKPYIPDLHPVLQLYLTERLKEAETTPAQRRTYAVMPSQAADLQRIMDSSRPGDTIRLQAGTYRLDKTLKLMDKSYLTLLADPGVEILISDPHAPVIEILRGNQVRLEGFRAKHEASSGCSTPVISIKDSRHIVLRHLELDGSGTHAVRMSFSRDILIEHNYLHSNSMAAIGFDVVETYGLKNVVIRFNRIENNPQIFQYAFFPGAGEIEFYGNTGQSLIRQRCEKVKEKKGNRYHKCGSYQ